MNEIEKSLDKVLEVLKNNGKDIKENVNTLKKEIDFIENSITSETDESYKRIKMSFDSLNTSINDAYNFTLNFNDLYDERLFSLRKNYYSTLSEMKNELLNFYIYNNDNLLSYYDDYINNKNMIYSSIYKYIESNKEINESYLNELSLLIFNSVNEEIDILSYQKERFNITTKKIIENVKEITLSFTNLYSNYISNINKIKNEYKKEINNLTDSINKDSLFMDYINKRVGVLLSFSLDLLKIKKEFNLLITSFDFELNMISIDSKKYLNDRLSNLKIKLLSLNKYRNNLFSDSDYLIKRNELDSEKTKEFLKYQIELYKVHEAYLKKESEALLFYELTKENKKISSLSYEMELERLEKRFLVEKNTIESSYLALKESLDRTKSREEVFNLSSYKFLESYFDHKMLIIGQAIDMAKVEYEFRINVISKAKDISDSYENKSINIALNKYLDEIEELERIKDIDLKNIKDKIDVFSKNDKLSKEEYNNELNNILTDFDKAKRKIVRIINRDPEITTFKDNINRNKNIIIDEFTSSEDIRKETLENVAKSMKDIENTFKSMTENIDSTSSIDYSKRYNEYKEMHDREINKINTILDNSSKNSKERIDEINKIYNLDRYIFEYNTLKENHKLRVNELYKEYKEKIDLIESSFKYNVDNISIKSLEDEINESMDRYSDQSFDYKMIYDNHVYLINSEYDREIELTKSSIKDMYKIINESSNTINKERKEILKMKK